MLVDEEPHIVAPYESAASIRPDKKVKGRETVSPFVYFLLFLISVIIVACA